MTDCEGREFIRLEPISEEAEAELIEGLKKLSKECGDRGIRGTFPFRVCESCSYFVKVGVKDTRCPKCGNLLRFHEVGEA